MPSKDKEIEKFLEAWKEIENFKRAKKIFYPKKQFREAFEKVVKTQHTKVPSYTKKYLDELFEIIAELAVDGPDNYKTWSKLQKLGSTASWAVSFEKYGRNITFVEENREEETK